MRAVLAVLENGIGMDWNGDLADQGLVAAPQKRTQHI